MQAERAGGGAPDGGPGAGGGAAALDRQHVPELSPVRDGPGQVLAHCLRRGPPHLWGAHPPALQRSAAGSERHASSERDARSGRGASSGAAPVPPAAAALDASFASDASAFADPDVAAAELENLQEMVSALRAKLARQVAGSRTEPAVSAYHRT